MNGNNVVIQYGIEAAYGEGGTATKQIEVSSPSFNLNINKKEEGLLTGSQVGGKKWTVSRSAEASFSALARPDDIGLFLATMLGNEAAPVLVPTSTGAYSHVFTLNTVSTIPSLVFNVKYDNDIIKKYTGITLDGISLSAEPEDFMKVDYTLKGKDEIDAISLDSGTTKSPLRPFRLNNAVLTVGTYTVDSSSVKFDMKNNLIASVMTNKTGLYFKRPTLGMRTMDIEMKLDYDAQAELIRKGYWVEDTVFSTSLTFLNGSEIETGFPYSIKIEMPTCQLSEATPSIGGASDPNTLPLKLSVVENGSAQPITITLVNGFNGSYLS